MTQHTQGPWYTQGYGDYICVAPGRPSPNICKMQNSDQIANALLIATAPELLKVLETVLKFSDCRESQNNVMKEYYDEARAVLNKAKGI